jgi:hypothetical protein
MTQSISLRAMIFAERAWGVRLNNAGIPGTFPIFPNEMCHPDQTTRHHKRQRQREWFRETK